MAFTAPVTRATDFLVTAAVWNAEHVDNFNTAVMHLANRKASDQSVTSSTTLVDATTMTLPVAASGIYKFEFQVIYSAGSTEDIQFAFTFPAAGRIDASVVWVDDGGTSVFPRIWSGTTTPTTSVALAGGFSGARLSLPIQGIFTNSSTAGNLQLQFAQVVSGATSSIVYANSTVWAVKLA